MVVAVEQPDVVGPKGVFRKSVSDMMTQEKGMTEDVAEMLVASKSLAANSENPPDAGMTDKLNNALRAMDDIQRHTGQLYDSAYDDYLDLYPAWRMYILSRDPVQQRSLFHDYKKLYKRYEKRQKRLIQNLGLLVGLQKALLPSNAYADPNNRIPPSEDTAAVLVNF